MLRIHFSWGLDYDLPEYDPEIHDPKEVFAMLCYRGVHYAKWVYLKVDFGGAPSWNITS